MELICTVLILGALLLGVWVTWRRVDRQREIWWELTHPPDSEIGEETSSGAAAPPSPKGEGKEGVSDNGDQG